MEGASQGLAPHDFARVTVLEREADMAAERAVAGGRVHNTPLSSTAPPDDTGGGGAPLPRFERAYFERAFGADLGNVRITPTPARPHTQHGSPPARSPPDRTSR